MVDDPPKIAGRYTLENYEGFVTNNDYAFVSSTDELGKARDGRYKYNASTEEWKFEYYLNNSSFTADQWNAIDSGITAEKVATYDAGMSPLGIINLVYPVGSIYTTINNINPGTMFANTTWEAVSSGRVLQGAKEGQSGGEEIAAALPNISGQVNGNALNNVVTGSGAFKNSTTKNVVGWSTGAAGNVQTALFDFKASNSNSIYKDGATVQPPAFTVYFWKRTA